jgi:hypothetical protein
MVAHLEKTEKGYTIPLTAEMVAALHLVEGAAVDVRPVETAATEEATPQIRYASVEEVLKMHREMEPAHAEAYRELAK